MRTWTRNTFDEHWWLWIDLLKVKFFLQCSVTDITSNSRNGPCWHKWMNVYTVWWFICTCCSTPLFDGLGLGRIFTRSCFGLGQRWLWILFQEQPRSQLQGFQCVMSLCYNLLYLMMVSMRENRSQVENLTHNKLSCVGRIVKHGNGLLNEEKKESEISHNGKSWK